MHIRWLVPDEQRAASSALPCSFNTRYQSSRNFGSFSHILVGNTTKFLELLLLRRVCAGVIVLLGARRGELGQLWNAKV
jgi:hypothetical protein